MNGQTAALFALIVLVFWLMAGCGRPDCTDNWVKAVPKVCRCNDGQWSDAQAVSGQCLALKAGDGPYCYAVGILQECQCPVGVISEVEGVNCEATDEN